MLCVPFISWISWSHSLEFVQNPGLCGKSDYPLSEDASGCTRKLGGHAKCHTEMTQTDLDWPSCAVQEHTEQLAHQ